MSDTRNLSLPYLAAGQAQKHVTVNEAFARIDAFAAPRALTAGRAAPPDAPEEGEVHVVGADAGGAWAGRDGALAAFSNGGWIFAAPRAGMRVAVLDERRELVHDGLGWTAAHDAPAAGAATALRLATLDHALGGAVAASLTAPVIPDKAIVLGVTARVTETLAGAGLKGWRLGVEGGSGRYGSGYGLGVGAFAHGVTGQPQAYWGATPLLIEAEGGAFEAGALRLCVHYLALTPPAAA